MFVEVGAGIPPTRNPATTVLLKVIEIAGLVSSSQATALNVLIATRRN